MTKFGRQNSKANSIIRILFLIAIVVLNLGGLRSFELIQDNSKKLDGLFEQLQNAPNSIVAQQYETEILVEISNSNSEAINVLMAAAQAAIEKDDFENALISLDEILKRDPDFHEARNNKAAILYRIGDKTAALHNLERIVKTEPRLNSAWAAIGNIRYEFLDIDGARAAFERALYLNPYNDMAKRGLFEIESKTTGIGM